MGLPLLQIDAFTNRAFGGNPAAVCILPRDADPAWMQQVAAEMNLSETAFLAPREDGFGLRWFTPAVEVPLCGHATLASSHAIWELDLAGKDAPITYYTHSGILRAALSDDMIWLDFPARFVRPADPPAALLTALGCTATWVGMAGEDYLVVLASDAEVQALDPDFRALRATAPDGVIVTSLSDDPGFDFVSRYFAPAKGIDEDPVTGSAHCALAPYWAHRLGRAALTGYQASKRGGAVNVKVDGDRVHLGGYAVTVVRGELAANALD
jgi:PhzF family phenazine biosynthesis protein